MVSVQPRHRFRRGLLSAAWAILQVSVLLGQEVDESANGWWSLQPVIAPAVPDADAGIDHPIDQFLHAEYRARGLTPAGGADKLTLLRRVYLDLIGLPPSPAEQDAFLADESPEAYERVVDRLLES